MRQAYYMLILTNKNIYNFFNLIVNGPDLVMYMEMTAEMSN